MNPDKFWVEYYKQPEGVFRWERFSDYDKALKFAKEISVENNTEVVVSRVSEVAKFSKK
jgi:hypothetical protein